MLAELPTELLREVVSHVNRVDQKSLCEVCKYLCDAMSPLLYNSLTISTTPLSIDGIVSRIERIPLKWLKYTKDICLRSVSYKDRLQRCIYPPYDPASDPQGIIDLDPSSNLMVALEILLSAVPKDGLRAFRWELGTCIPKGLLSGDGGPLANQQWIETLSLRTGLCDGGIPMQYTVDFGRFRHLQSISWDEMFAYDTYESIRKCIAVNKEIKAWDLGLASSLWRSIIPPSQKDFRFSFFIEKVLELQPGMQKRCFPSLESLCFRDLPLRGMEAELAYTLQVERLRTLKLCYCAGSVTFLGVLAESKSDLRLTTLEVSFYNVHPRYEFEPFKHLSVILARFLGGFQGLENLYLRLPHLFL
ncbi:uncharacterized protein GIQ15_04985 [Arthroderma uncinatum]|uniref:uncharacterized protein n=1 Tax=Arthroderma uncinatum TaxID=74035 RepID=UPI00144A5982|nr:uncharacterized protein GIQ15_04985 [Arthroderma uncinatum]KAF3482226.1 hypothetical protein GIQ15_04985 [Arthroderma uncinatum]